MEPRRRRRLTGFIVALRRIMEARAMYSWDDLFYALERVRYPRDYETVMQYVYGEQFVEETFMRYIARALALRKDERERLAYAWAYLQGQDDEPKTHLHEVSITLGWDEEKKREAAYRYLFGPVPT